MLHRIREAMKREPLAGLLSGTIVADETFIGGRPSNRPKGKRPVWGHLAEKTAVLALVSRETGEVRSQIVPDVTGATLAKVIRDQVAMQDSTLNTDESKSYITVCKEFAIHKTVNHSEDQYLRSGATTNEAEGYFSQLKRSLDGTQHHVSVDHVPRYLAEHDCRFSTREMDDSQRMRSLRGATGQRRSHTSHWPVSADVSPPEV